MYISERRRGRVQKRVWIGIVIGAEGVVLTVMACQQQQKREGVKVAIMTNGYLFLVRST